MASFISLPQLMIHESELNEILRVVNTAKDPELKVVGNLFGLWKNSLMQPVVQLITGPGKRAKVSKNSFSADGVYHIGTKKYLEEKHGLMQIGLWCSGNANRYPALNRGNPDCDFNNALMPDKGRYIVLMFIDNTSGNLEIEYHMIDRKEEELSRVGNLGAKDILPGASSFRLLMPVFDKINEGVMYPSYQNHNTSYFSTSMLTTTPHRPAIPTNSNDSSTGIVDSSQWHVSDADIKLLPKPLKNGFDTHDVSVGRRKDSNSNDAVKKKQSNDLHSPTEKRGQSFGFKTTTLL